MPVTAERRHFRGSLRPILNPHTIPLPRMLFTRSEMTKIRHGFIPACLNDIWFAYMQGNTLFLHLSWTGHAIYQPTFADSVYQLYSIGSALVTDDIPDVAKRGSNRRESRAVLRTICKIFELRSEEVSVVQPSSNQSQSPSSIRPTLHNRLTSEEARIVTTENSVGALQR